MRSSVAITIRSAESSSAARAICSTAFPLRWSLVHLQVFSSGTWGHGGFFPGYNSQMFYFPEHGVAVAMQINTDRSRVGDHVVALAKVVLDALP